MIITIDGPAGAGKSTLARKLAERIGFRFLDTGAMYRAIAWAALQRRIDPTDHPALRQLVSESDLRIDEDQVWLDGTNISAQLRSPEVTQAVRFVADNAEVRDHLTLLQRKLAGQGNIVTEGRDQGTVAFPDAECKIFLTASPEERAKRRQAQLRAGGQAVSLDQVLSEQNRRDDHDSNRRVGQLKKADDAIEVSTNGLGVDEVLDQLARIVIRK